MQRQQQLASILLPVHNQQQRAARRAGRHRKKSPWLDTTHGQVEAFRPKTWRAQPHRRNGGHR